MPKKATIPKAVREQCWLTTIGKKYEAQCYVKWCNNTMTVFDFHVGHDQPESKGGTLDINNLKAICARCNLSMSDNYTIQEWTQLSKPKNKCLNCFSFSKTS
jgi:hypothetical protein|tara:strand:- start:14 stop:319 length:306 start_codon:yes stop_codon:yes gene_type:complete